MSAAGGDPGGIRDDKLARGDAPGSNMDKSPAGMELTFPTGDPIAFDAAELPETVSHTSSSRQSAKKIFSNPATTDLLQARKVDAYGPVPKQREKPTQFREQFDQLMSRLEDRFQNERLSLEEKHSRELEEAMGYFSLSSGEREAKRQELQMSLLEDIGDMAQQLQELTGTLGADDDTGENLTLPSDPKVLEMYASRMQNLEEHFQKEKTELERKHALEMEEALGTLKISRGQRDAKQFQLQEEISAEIGGISKQLEELNRAKEAYESKMAVLKQQLSQDDRSSIRPRADPDLKSISQRLINVERERDSAKDELRRLKLALQVTQGDVGPGVNTYSLGDARRVPQPNTAAWVSDQEGGENIASLRGRIEEVEKELKEAAQTPGGSSKMKRLRDRMKSIENDLARAEESTKEHFALEHLRARLEKVEQLLTEGERAARDWEALEELRNKIGNVDNDLKAVEEAKKEFEALEALRAKMEAVESELKVAEQLAMDRENVDKLRQRLGQVEKELGFAEPPSDDHASIDKLLARLAKAETSLEDARKSTKMSEKAFAVPPPSGRSMRKAERDEEVERILERLAQAEQKLKAARESAQRRSNRIGYPATSPATVRPQSAIPFDERQSKIRARLQEHFEEIEPKRQERGNQTANLTNETPRSRLTVDGNHWSRGESPRARGDPRAFSLQYEPIRETTSYGAPRDLRSQRAGPREYRTSYVVEPKVSRARDEESRDISRVDFEDQRTAVGLSRDNRYYVEDVRSDRAVGVEATRYGEEATSTQGQETATASTNPPLADNNGPNFPRGEARPLRRRRPGDVNDRAVPSQPTSFSVLGHDDEDRYVADLEELRYQRALLAQKLPKKNMEEEEKKADDLPKYPSFKETIRNEEKRLQREKIHPMPKRMPKTKLESGKPSTVELPGLGDPPVQSAENVSMEPPTQVPTMENDLKRRLQSQTREPGRDPNARDPGAPDPNTREENAKASERGISDPPELIGPPTIGGGDGKGTETSHENPSDEEVRAAPDLFSYDAASISTAGLHLAVAPEERIAPKPASSQQVPMPPPTPQQENTPPEEGAPALQATFFAEQGQQNASPTPPPVSQHYVAQAPPTPTLQQPIFHQTTVVDSKVAARERREKDRLMRWVVLVLLFLAIVLVVGIVVVVVLLRDNSTAPKSTDPTAPTSSPTFAPSFGNGTFANGTFAPTGTSTLDSSMENSNLAFCPMLDSTEPLTPDGSTLTLSTVGASFDPLESMIVGCGEIEELQSNGVWYALIGTGDTLTVSTCTQFYPSFNTQLSVFTPSNQTTGCAEGLECVTSNDDFCGQQSSVTFASMNEQLYFVYVSGTTTAPQFDTASEGEFSLTVSSSPKGSCQGAEYIVPSANGQLPVINVGELLGGTFSIDPCNPDLQTRTGERWYTVTGTGKYLVASTCHYLSHFKANVAVYTGPQCEVLACLAADDDDCGNGYEINWFAEEGTTYFLLVYTPTFTPDVQFGLTVQEVL